MTSVANTSHPCAAFLISQGVKVEVRSLSLSRSFFLLDERCPATLSLLGRPGAVMAPRCCASSA